MPAAVSNVNPAARPGLRERKREQVQALLLETALRLFASRGYSAVTVEHIVQEAGVSRSTFFRYFDTKDAVLFHHSAQALDDMLADFTARRRAGTGRRSALRQAILAASVPFEEQRNYFRLLHRLMEQDRSLRLSYAENNRAITNRVAGLYLSDTPERRTALAGRVEAAALWSASLVAMETWIGVEGTDLHTLTLEAFAALDRHPDETGGTALPDETVLSDDAGQPGAGCPG